MAKEIRPPSMLNQALEGRFGLEAAQLFMQLPGLRRRVPGGAGGVLVLPGFMADDNSTWLMRRFLNSLGYTAQGWGLGVNRGKMMGFLPLVTERLEIHDEPQHIVGWSRGGVIAREVARDRPELVRSIVTMGSPVQGGLDATSIGNWVERETGVTPSEVQEMLRERQHRKIQVPITAVYSKTDGVVSWQACVDEMNDHVSHKEVNASHVGMGSNAAVFREVAHALHEHGANTEHSSD